MRLIDTINEYNLDENSWALVYTHDKVYLEKLNKLDDKVKNLSFDQFKEARVFNEGDELKFWHYQGEVKTRLFSETKKPDYEVYDDEMLLQKVFRKDGLQKVITKSYYTFNEDGLIRFEDARLVSIEECKQEEK